ncbi:hypothetical protein [Natrinema versiforme]|uniref:Uncharacterized protein n=1 Tax=Natrinema versiforme JCM 10478 TaxID=1227496 RepID=L9Y4D0_9EURY|nr:hypothetical protein [Natrinema versiforme]ELY68925.1 hypothetical protein C489_06148 [Natrinema versiforme JCM 10478]
MAAKNSTADDEPLTETEQQAVDVIETAGEGDQVLFNDRVQPLTVKRDNGSPVGLGKDNSLVLEGPRGGRYTLSHNTRYGNSVSLQRHTGYNDDGFRTYDDLTLESVELVNHHEFRIGQVLEVTDPLCEEYYEVVTDLSDGGCYDVETVGIRIRDGEIAGTKETGLFYSHDKERLFNGQLEVVDDLGLWNGSRAEYYDTEADETVYLSDPHIRGVDCRPVDGTGLEVVDWDTILFGDRFELADKDDEKEVMTDGGTVAASGTERYCGTCGSEFDEWSVRDGYGPVFETIEYTCPNGHRAKEHYDRRGYVTQSLGVKRRSRGTEGGQ